MEQQPIIAPAKPIIVIRIYHETLFRQYSEIQRGLKETFPDYNVLVVSSVENEVEIETYYEKDMKPITFFELQKKVEDSLKHFNDTRISNQ